MRRITAAAILAATTFHAFARDLPAASPESVGMSSERLDRIGAAMHRYVGDGKIAGMVSLVARHGKIVYANAVGEQALTNKPAMARDTLFRICSMTKPITAVTAMTFYEEGGFPLTDPISTYLPEFKDLKVLEGCTIPRTGCCRAKTPTLAGFGGSASRCWSTSQNPQWRVSVGEYSWAAPREPNSGSTRSKTSWFRLMDSPWPWRNELKALTYQAITKLN